MILKSEFNSDKTFLTCFNALDNGNKVLKSSSVNAASCKAAFVFFIASNVSERFTPSFFSVITPTILDKATIELDTTFALLPISFTYLICLSDSSITESNATSGSS